MRLQCKDALLRSVEKVLPPSWSERLRGYLGADGESLTTMRHLGRMRD
jgi:hypothetical protein